MNGEGVEIFGRNKKNCPYFTLCNFIISINTNITKHACYENIYLHSIIIFNLAVTEEKNVFLVLFLYLH